MEKLEQAKKLYQAKKYKESFSLFKSMSDQAEAAYFLGMHYLRGLSTKQNNDKAFQFFKKSWEGLFHEGIYMLGFCYEHGLGVQKDIQQAFKLYDAARDSVNAKLRLAKMYEHGQVVEQDLIKAIKLYNEIQKYDNGYAMYKIGRFYLTGTGLKKNLNNGYKWLHKALAENEILAVNYFRLIGSKPSTDNRTVEDIVNQAKSAIEKANAEYALSYLEVAIEEASKEALMILVDLYLSGDLLEKSEETAFKLLLKYQKLEDPDVYHRLGTFYEKGIGTVSSYYKASLFYQKASDLGHDGSKQALYELRGF
jgi:hypothetical protein